MAIFNRNMVNNMKINNHEVVSMTLVLSNDDRDSELVLESYNHTSIYECLEDIEKEVAGICEASTSKLNEIRTILSTARNSKS